MHIFLHRHDGTAVIVVQVATIAKNEDMFYRRAQNPNSDVENVIATVMLTQNVESKVELYTSRPQMTKAA